jgi:RNA polymerase sigma factor (sigma-70 family)
MKEDEISLWKRYRLGDEKAFEELICFYLYLVKLWVNRVSRYARWANREDLMQDGIIGLIKAVERFDSDRGFEFSTYAQYLIREAIFDSPELTRGLPRLQYENIRKIRDAIEEVTQGEERMMAIEEVAERTGLTTRQVENALEAMYIAFAGGLPDTEELSRISGELVAGQERMALIRSAISQLEEKEETILIRYYIDGRSHQEIAKELGLGESNVSKIRQRTLGKLRKRFDARTGGRRNEAERPGE